MFHAVRSFDWLCLEAIRSIRTPLLNKFFLFWNLFDRQEFFILLVACLWIFYSRSWAIRLFLISSLSYIVNFLMKSLFGIPRPGFEDPSISLVWLGSFAFPSGASQTAIWLPALAIAFFRTRLAWVVGIAFGITLSFSRLWLGVHYPSDIVGGWVIGSGIVFFWLTKWQTLERQYVALPPRKRFAIAQGTAFILSYALSSFPFAILFGALSGMSIGDYLLEERFWYSPPISTSKRAVIGFGGMAFFTLLLAPLRLIPLMAALWGIWLSIGIPLTYSHILPWLNQKNIRRVK